jgi:hypothetical protein
MVFLGHFLRHFLLDGHPWMFPKTISLQQHGYEKANQHVFFHVRDIYINSK